MKLYRFTSDWFFWDSEMRNFLIAMMRSTINLNQEFTDKTPYLNRTTCESKWERFAQFLCAAVSSVTGDLFSIAQNVERIKWRKIYAASIIRRKCLFWYSKLSYRESKTSLFTCKLFRWNLPIPRWCWIWLVNSWMVNAFNFTLDKTQNCCQRMEIVFSQFSYDFDTIKSLTLSRINKITDVASLIRWAKSLQSITVSICRRPFIFETFLSILFKWNFAEWILQSSCSI